MGSGWQESQPAICQFRGGIRHCRQGHRQRHKHRCDDCVRESPHGADGRNTDNVHGDLHGGRRDHHVGQLAPLDRVVIPGCSDQVLAGFGLCNCAGRGGAGSGRCVGYRLPGRVRRQPACRWTVEQCPRRSGSWRRGCACARRGPGSCRSLLRDPGALVCLSVSEVPHRDGHQSLGKQRCPAPPPGGNPGCLVLGRLLIARQGSHPVARRVAVRLCTPVSAHVWGRGQTHRLTCTGVRLRTVPDVFEPAA